MNEKFPPQHQQRQPWREHEMMPLIPVTFPISMKRVGQPSEIAPSYVFLASSNAPYITGQVIHPNGGAVVNG